MIVGGWLLIAGHVIFWLNNQLSDDPDVESGLPSLWLAVAVLVFGAVIEQWAKAARRAHEAERGRSAIVAAGPAAPPTAAPQPVRQPAQPESVAAEPRHALAGTPQASETKRDPWMVAAALGTAIAALIEAIKS